MLSNNAKLKIVLLLFATAIILGLLYYTNRIVEQLQAREKQVATLCARGLQLYNHEDAPSPILDFVKDEIITVIDFPIILTSPKREVISHKNLDLSKGIAPQEEQKAVAASLASMSQKNPPIVITYADSLIANYFFYDESRLVRSLRLLPYIEIFVAGIFIIVGYLSFSYIRRSEQSNVWVGMSKETAHQLGTPLSSLMGWIELLDAQKDQPEHVGETVTEMRTDLERLNKIAMRFSKIGSKPDLQEQDVTAIIGRVLHYFEKRIPQMQKRVELSLTSREPIRVKLNAELFEWVLENLIKNGLDAIEDGAGKIHVVVLRTGSHVSIDVHDTGKGIDARFKKDVFRPGFSTKKRGWGLGLSLSKRIIENYHRGKLTVVESSAAKGTTFRIKLPA